MKSFPSSSGLLVGENSREGIGRLERWMDDFATVQMEMQASIDSQTSMYSDTRGVVAAIDTTTTEQGWEGLHTPNGVDQHRNEERV
jgi:hypothetical protein